MLQPANTNPLIELADELQNGDKSLKDLYYEQLISDLKHLDDKEYVDDLDFDADEEFRDNSSVDKVVSVASFNFTKNVMNKVREQSHLKQTQAKKTTSSTFGLYLGNFNKSYTDKETNNTSEPTQPIAKTSTNYGGYFPQPKTPASQQSQWGGSQSLYSQTPETDSTTTTSTSSVQPNPTPAATPIAPAINPSQTVAQESNSHSSSKHYVLLALIAFALSFIVVISINVYRNSFNTSSSSFSTLASNVNKTPDTSLTTTTKSTNTVAAAQHVDATSSDSAYHTKIINLKQSLALSSLQSNLVTYHPTPILYGVKLIGFRQEHQIAPKLVLKPKQAYNLSVLLNNYQIQRRLVN